MLPVSARAELITADDIRILDVVRARRRRGRQQSICPPRRLKKSPPLALVAAADVEMHHGIPVAARQLIFGEQPDLELMTVAIEVGGRWHFVSLNSRVFHFCVAAGHFGFR
jgi:hypothetical protein